MAKMSDVELKALLEAEKSSSISSMKSSSISSERENAMRYYLGDMTKDMPTIEGQSQAVSTDVADTVLGMMPFLMDVFCSSDDVMKFNPVGPEDEEGAEQESDYLNHVFMDQNPGFVILYEYMFDSLLQKLGAVKIWWDTHEEEEKETYLGLMADQFAKIANDVLTSDGALEIIEHDEEQKPGVDPVTGQPAMTVVHNVTLLRTKKYAQAKVESCAPEEIGWGRNTRSMKNCTYFYHSPPDHTESTLIAQGYDKEQVRGLPTQSHTTSEETARDTVNESFWLSDESNKSARPIQITEHYIRMDYKGDGKACLYKVTTAGTGEILIKDKKPDIEEVDVIPFAVLTPILQPHRLCGRSVADLVMDVQRINTALTRGLLDNSYMVANPRHEVVESGAGVNTIDDLLTVRRNGIVRVKNPGTVTPLATQSIVGELLPVLSYMDGVREMRSGVTRQGQGVDADALQNQSATAVNQVFSVAQAKMKLIARIFAETGIRDLFWLLHATIKKHGQEAQTVKLRNKWVNVDPRNWKTRSDMTVNVGLGDGGKSEQYAKMMGIGNIQEKLVMAGKTNIVGDKELYNAAAELTKISGHKNPDKFFKNPEEKDPQTGELKNPPPEPPPNPDLLKIQADTQMKQQELQMKGQEIQANAAIDQAADQRKAGIEQVQMQADIEAQDRKTQAEMALAQQKFEFERELKLMDFQLKREMQAAELEMKREQHQQALQSGQLGMVASAMSHDAKMEQMSSAEAGE
jgi:hypothetical protein